MIREDYILRLIQQLGEFLRRSIRGTAAVSAEELDQHIEQLTGEILGLPTTLIVSLPPDNLIELFEMSDRMVVEKCFVTAEIHRLKAKVETDPGKRRKFLEKAVFFLDTVRQHLTGDLAALADKHLEDLKSELTH